MRGSVRDIGTFDYIIVGAGSAGCVLANRLTSDPAIRVLLLEAGANHSGLWVKVPVGFVKIMGRPKYDWCFQSEPNVALGGRTVTYPRGKIIGGSSAINGHVYTRGQAADYDRWRNLGNVGWGWADVLPYFKKSEHQEHGPDEWHGIDGPLYVSDSRCQMPLLEVFLRAAAEIGITRISDFNRGTNEGCGYFQVNQKNGKRWSSADAYLSPIKSRNNLTVIPHAHASRILFTNKEASAVEFWMNGERALARSKGEVIVSAGTIGSPHLLQLSGVGPGSVLKENGVDVLHDLPGVGENLQEHVILRMIYRVSGIGTLNETLHSSFGILRMVLDYFLFRKGPMTMGPSQAGAFTRSSPAVDRPDLQILMQPLSLPVGAYTKMGPGATDPFPAFTVPVVLIRPKSRGRVIIKGSAWDSKPAICTNLLSRHEDAVVGARGIEIAQKLVLGTSAFAPYRPVAEGLTSELSTAEDLLSAVYRQAGMIYHGVGTCKMGNDPWAVVDDRLRLRGIKKLRVVDGSIIPEIISGPTHAAIVMIAEKASDMILADRRQT